MARINNDRPPVNGVSQTLSKATSYDPTTKKVTAAAGKVAHSQAQAKGMKEHKVTQKAGGDNLSVLVTKGSGKQRALEVTKVATPILNRPSLANKTKIRSAHIAKSTPKMDAASKRVLGKS